MNDHTVPVSGTDLRLLLLDDLRADADYLIHQLERARPTWQVVWVKDEAGYLQALEAGGFALILSDYTLPGYSGAEALEAARRLRPELPFILLSGMVGEDNAAELIRQGAIDFVTKSRLTRLPMVVERAVREAQERRQREAAEMRLRDANALYARVVDSLKDYAVLRLDHRGDVQSWNPAATGMFGYAADEVLGHRADMLYLPEDRDQGLLERKMALALAEGRATDNRWMARKDGTRLRTDGVLTPLDSAAGEPTGFTKVLRDVTHAYEAEQALHAAKEEAERANHAKDRFLAVLSHELRTPLTPISNAVHLLEKHATVPQTLANLLPMIRRNVTLEARLIDDLLDLTSIGQGKLNLQFTDVDGHQVVRTVVEMLDEDLRHKRIALHVALDATQAALQGDEARLQQIIWNVVRNAVKFTPEGGEIRLSTHNPSPNEWELACSDTGIGIHAQALPRIFIAFEQADEGVTRKFGGLGLGLAIAHSLAAQHQGTLLAFSDGPDLGATFRLRLPLDPATAPAAASGTEAPAPRAAHGAMRVLLVEDNEDAALSMQMALEYFGHHATIAGTCADALRRAASEPFDVVVTDLGLPDGSGLQLGRALGARLPVVALSGYGSEADIRLSRESGFAEHLTKPIDPEMLHRLLLDIARKPARSA